MNWKRFFIALVVVFLAANCVGIVINQYLLTTEWGFAKNVLRSPQDMASKTPFFWLGCLGFALGFVWIYAKGMDAAKHWLGQGMRYGAAVWCLVSAYGYFTMYAAVPVGRRLVAKGLFYELIAWVLLGALTAGIYRKEGATVK